MNRQERTAFTRARKFHQAELYIGHRTFISNLNAELKTGALNEFEYKKLKTKCPKVQEVLLQTPRLLPEKKNNSPRKSLLNLRECARTESRQTSEDNRLAKIARKKELQAAVNSVADVTPMPTAVTTKKSLKPKKVLQ